MTVNADILLVEDNISDADLIMRSLKKNNLANKVLHLKDGQEALDYMFCEGEWAEKPPSILPRLILLDLKMPKVDGIEVLRRFKGSEKIRMVPVVVLTSSKEDPDVKECYELGVNSYVTKPVHFDEFVKAISQLGLYWLLINEPPKV